MITRINEAEHSQLIAELRQRIAELEIKNQEYQTANQIAPHQSPSSPPADVPDSHENVSIGSIGH